MPSSKRWTADECHILAIAAVSNASQNKSEMKKVGANQKLGQLQAKIFDNVHPPPPPPPGALAPYYHHRGTDALWIYWRDKIQPELNKFNIALRMVNASNPTGMDQQQKVNMAITIHLGKTECMNYKYKDFNCHEWLYYLAWDIIKNTAKFSPPKPGNMATIANAATIANVASIADGVDIGEDDVDVESTNENDSMMNVMVTMKVASWGSSKGKKGAEQDAKCKKEVKEKMKEIRKLRKVMIAKLESSNHLARVLELKTVVDLTVGGADPDEYESAKKS